ncbi:hypothetical protein AWB70_07469 [Caballeronia cordobensis]|uniref:Uncharacterized protein n=1 Tax=Caballeronia cordobensis TaxID=1353886 RepID=A0A158JSX2_CABCO|nr:hypothetical protein AWB70_07469 [Caballeronia cordobensis]
MHASALRAAGAAHARCHCARLQGRIAHLCAGQCARQPARASADRAGRQARRPRGAVHGARHRRGGRALRDPQVRGRLYTARSGVSRRTPELHSRRCRASLARRRCRGPSRTGRRRHARRGRSRCIARRCAHARRSACARSCIASSRLCDLHVRFDRQAQGRDGRASPCDESASRLACDRVRALRAALERDAERQHRIRCLRAEPHRLAGGPPARHRARRRAHRCDGAGRFSRYRRHRRIRLHADSTRIALLRRPARTAPCAADRARRRRAAHAANLEPSRARRADSRLQRLWPDRMHRGCDRRADHGRADAARHRQAARQHAHLCARCAATRGAAGSGGRTVYRRRGRGARLSEPARTHGRALPRRSVRARRTHLSHGRSRALSSRWQYRVPRPQRSSDQDSRLPYRARRDRGSDREPPCRTRCSGDRACAHAGFAGSATHRLCNRER